MGKKVKVENSLSIILGKASRLLSNQISKNMAEYRVTAEQWAILASLWRHDGQGQQALADMANKNKASITHLIDNLEKRKLVTRQADESDRRNKIIFLTEEGRSLQEELAKIVKKTTKEVTRDIDKKELKSAKKVMKRMIEKLLAD
ncbi:MarR family winged helix-turn-helix transcriptional regulator [Catalinimonas niigatensis]|uniref:MarR family winged helix-turn-helix transcriptional regulator n=1 Tax=Catalinimonas niigatensis TaxID=1397264 RepID=UPI002666A638|nr:MarR family transcriptional regulator [Catalinimonas niigatensis]WPP52587.1 MarR family transcriptional regulator [Catalinimonas niigatensis]